MDGKDVGVSSRGLDSGEAGGGGDFLSGLASPPPSSGKAPSALHRWFRGSECRPQGSTASVKHTLQRNCVNSDARVHPTNLVFVSGRRLGIHF